MARPVPLRRALPGLLLAAALVATGTTPAIAAPTTATTTTTTTTGTTTSPTSTGASITGLRLLEIPGHDGVRLRANLITPTTAGPHPAIVFVSSWGLNDAEYLAQATAFARAGYVVLSYTPRGWWGSGGQIDTAGPADIADVSAVLDWLTANTTADPTRIGMGGVSYGAGISLIAAGHDARIRAVSALSGWTDLIESLYGGQTRRPQAVWLLNFTAALLGNRGTEFRQIIDDYFANRNIDRITAWGGQRSAATYLDGLRANRPAVLIANAYGDSLFAPNQLIDFFGELTGPKRLELAPGDHAIPELTGLIGLPNPVWASTRAWFDTHLAGGAPEAQSQVRLTVRNAPNVIESYHDWADVTGSIRRYHLGDVPWYDRTGPLSTTPTTGWSESFRATGNTVADAGVVLLSNGLEVLTGTPATAWLPAVNRLEGKVWQTGTLTGGAAVRGIPRLHLKLTPSAANGTVVCYLYDVDPLGTGKLITHAPVTWTGARAGQPLTLDVALPATAWNVPAGHRLALVVDTKDPLYLDANPYAATISINAGSWLDVPLR